MELGLGGLKTRRRPVGLVSPRAPSDARPSYRPSALAGAASGVEGQGSSSGSWPWGKACLSPPADVGCGRVLCGLCSVEELCFCSWFAEESCQERVSRFVQGSLGAAVIAWGFLQGFPWCLCSCPASRWVLTVSGPLDTVNPVGWCFDEDTCVSARQGCWGVMSLPAFGIGVMLASQKERDVRPRPAHGGSSSWQLLGLLALLPRKPHLLWLFLSSSAPLDFAGTVSGERQVSGEKVTSPCWQCAPETLKETPQTSVSPSMLLRKHPPAPSLCCIGVQTRGLTRPCQFSRG